MRNINRLTAEELKDINKELSERFGKEGMIATASICIEGEEKNFYFSVMNQNAYKPDTMLRSIGETVKKYFEVDNVYCMGKLVG